MKSRRRIGIFVSVAALLLAAVVLIALSGPFPKQLSEERLDELRRNYPQHYRVEDALIGSIPPRPVDLTIKAGANAFVVVDVVEQLPNKVYSVVPEDGSSLGAILDKQGQSSLDIECVEQRVLIRDVFYQGDVAYRELNPSLAVQPGDTITVSFHAEQIHEDAILKTGQRYVLPLIIRTETGSGYDYTYDPVGLYYVVEDHYVLSFYTPADEDLDLEGMRLKDFEKVVLDILENPSIWDLSPTPQK